MQEQKINDLKWRSLDGKVYAYDPSRFNTLEDHCKMQATAEAIEYWEDWTDSGMIRKLNLIGKLTLMVPEV